MIVLSGRSHPEFTEAICKALSIPQSVVRLNKFANGESGVEIEESVRDKHVFIVQTGYDSVNDNFIELLILIHACKSASARKGI